LATYFLIYFIATLAVEILLQSEKKKCGGEKKKEDKGKQKREVE